MSVRLLSLLELLLAAVALYFARYRDRRDGPLALMISFVAVSDQLIIGIKRLLRLAPAGRLPLLTAAWCVDSLIVGWFGAHAAAAHWYRRRLPPRRLGLWWAAAAAAMLAAMLATALLHAPPATRSVCRHLLSLAFVALACYHEVRLLQGEDVPPPLLVLAASTLISLLQLVVAITPLSWRGDLMRGAVLVYLSGALFWYAARLAVVQLQNRRPSRAD